MGETRVFLDTSVLFAAVWSETGGARLILKLGEAGAVSLWVGPWVLQEADAVLKRKSEQSRAYLALLMERARIEVGQAASETALAQALSVIDYLPDAQILAEAIESKVDYLTSLDRKHLVGNPKASGLSFGIGTPAMFLEWYRQRLVK